MNKDIAKIAVDDLANHIPSMTVIERIANIYEDKLTSKENEIKQLRERLLPFLEDEHIVRENLTAMLIKLHEMQMSQPSAPWESD